MEMRFGRDGASLKKGRFSDLFESAFARIAILAVLATLLWAIDWSGAVKSPQSHKSSAPFAVTVGINPFEHLPNRNYTKTSKSGTDDIWWRRGIARLGAPSTYIGLWDSQRFYALRYDIRTRVKKYQPLQSTGFVRITGQPEMLMTDLGAFEYVELSYKPRSGKQTCAYFLSAYLQNGVYIRGHYCEAKEKGLEINLLRCMLSSVEHASVVRQPNAEPHNCDRYKR